MLYITHSFKCHHIDIHKLPSLLLYTIVHLYEHKWYPKKRAILCVFFFLIERGDTMEWRWIRKKNTLGIITYNILQVSDCLWASVRGSKEYYSERRLIFSLLPLCILRRMRWVFDWIYLCALPDSKLLERMHENIEQRVNEDSVLQSGRANEKKKTVHDAIRQRFNFFVFFC